MLVAAVNLVVVVAVLRMKTVVEKGQFQKDGVGVGADVRAAAAAAAAAADVVAAETVVVLVADAASNE